MERGTKSNDKFEIKTCEKTYIWIRYSLARCGNVLLSLLTFCSAYGLGKPKSFYTLSVDIDLEILQYSKEIDMRLFAFAITCGQFLPYASQNERGEERTKKSRKSKRNNESANNKPFARIASGVLDARIHKIR